MLEKTFCSCSNTSSAGPSQHYVWISLVCTLSGAIVMLIGGRLTDIFGRRWFFTLGNALFVSLSPAIRDGHANQNRGAIGALVAVVSSIAMRRHKNSA